MMPPLISNASPKKVTVCGSEKASVITCPVFRVRQLKNNIASFLNPLVMYVIDCIAHSAFAIPKVEAFDSTPDAYLIRHHPKIIKFAEFNRKIYAIFTNSIVLKH